MEVQATNLRSANAPRGVRHMRQETGQVEKMGDTSPKREHRSVGNKARDVTEKAKKNVSKAVKRGHRAKAPSNAVIRFDDVTKIYEAQPDEPALYDLNLEVTQGEFVFLVGHSGSGKSSIIRMIIKEVEPTKGTITVGGQELNTMRTAKVPYLRRNIGCVFQDYKLLPNKTAYENVAFAMECIGRSEKDIETHVPEVLKLVGLADKQDKFPNELSGGEQQRVSIARAIVNQPPLLVCDEPTGNLDPQTSQDIMELLLRIHAAGTTVLMATHDKDIVNALKMRVVKLSGGHIVSDEQEGSYDGQ